MSTTVEGYGERTKSKVDAIRMLKRPEVWLDGDGRYTEDMDDTTDLLGVVRRLCKVRTGK